MSPGNSSEKHDAARKRSPSTYERRADLAARIVKCSARADELGGGSALATSAAISNVKQIIADAPELLALLEARYEAIKDAPAGGSWQ